MLGPNFESVISMLLVLVGFGVSFFLGDIKGNKEKIKNLIKKFKENKKEEVKKLKP